MVESGSEPTVARHGVRLNALCGERLGRRVVRTTALDHQAFDPEATHAMCVAFDMACSSLRVTPRQDLVAEILAGKIIEAAAAGERDALRLHAAVMRWAAAA